MGMNVSRRGFVGTLGAAVGAGCLPDVAVFANAAIEPDKVVHTSGDGIGITPREYASLLNRLCQGREVAEDNYLLGGEVAAFERHWATLLGKEAAVFMPSGTLANQLALRVLAGSKRRVIVPEVSHIYNDTGDACQTLSGLTLMPLAPGRATFTRADVEAVLTRTAGGRVAADVGVIVVESPIRRLSGQMFDWDEAKRVAALARDKGIAMHLDGARLFIASAYTGISPAEYAAQFDTVYVSLWKYFNCGIGAILAGPKRVLDGMFHVRRMFGGNLAAGWNAAVVARHFMDGFEDRLKSAVKTSETFYAAMSKHPRIAIERIPNGTNLTRVTFKGISAGDVSKRLAGHGIAMSAASGAATVTFGVNETWTRLTAADLIRAFEQSLA
jgi:threonine aldolase